MRDPQNTNDKSKYKCDSCEKTFTELSEYAYHECFEQPERKPLNENDPCPECGYPFDSDEWSVRHLSGGPSIGEDWIYTCPSCEQETCIIGT